MTDLRSDLALREHFGFASFRPGQEEAVRLRSPAATC